MEVPIAERGRVSELIECLRCGDDDTIEAASRALMNLARQKGNRQLIGDMGGLKPLVKCACCVRIVFFTGGVLTSCGTV